MSISAVNGKYLEKYILYFIYFFPYFPYKQNSGFLDYNNRHKFLKIVFKVD